MLLRIEGRELPGLSDVVVAVQARDKPYALLDPVRADATQVRTAGTRCSAAQSS